jgi:hypothetical protein
MLARGRWFAGPQRSCLKRPGAGSKVSEQRNDLSLPSEWASNMGGRGDGTGDHPAPRPCMLGVLRHDVSQRTARIVRTEMSRRAMGTDTALNSPANADCPLVPRFDST